MYELADDYIRTEVTDTFARMERGLSTLADATDANPACLAELLEQWDKLEQMQPLMVLIDANHANIKEAKRQDLRQQAPKAIEKWLYKQLEMLDQANRNMQFADMISRMNNLEEALTELGQRKPPGIAAKLKRQRYFMKEHLTKLEKQYGAEVLTWYELPQSTESIFVSLHVGKEIYYDAEHTLGQLWERIAANIQKRFITECQVLKQQYREQKISVADLTAAMDKLGQFWQSLPEVDDWMEVKEHLRQAFDEFSAELEQSVWQDSDQRDKRLKTIANWIEWYGRYESNRWYKKLQQIGDRALGTVVEGVGATYRYTTYQRREHDYVIKTRTEISKLKTDILKALQKNEIPRQLIYELIDYHRYLSKHLDFVKSAYETIMGITTQKGNSGSSSEYSSGGEVRYSSGGAGSSTTGGGYPRTSGGYRYSGNRGSYYSGTGGNPGKQSKRSTDESGLKKII